MVLATDLRQHKRSCFQSAEQPEAQALSAGQYPQGVLTLGACLWQAPDQTATGEASTKPPAVIDEVHLVGKEWAAQGGG